MKWIIDPKDKNPSVSLTLLVLATCLIVVFIFVEAFTNLKSTTLLDELFFTSYSLYFGRRVPFLNRKK